MIRDLHDDLLQRILSFLPAASDVARTSVLSRRWRHLWPNAVALRFAIGDRPDILHDTDQVNHARRLIAAADAAIARRAAVEALELNFVYTSRRNLYASLPSRGCFYLLKHRHSGDITPAHVAAWLRFAERRVTGSFKLAVPTLTGHEMDALLPPAHERKRYAELPVSSRAEALSLSLGYASVTVPAAGAGAFRALGDLHLGHAQIEPGGADERNLGHLLSAAVCPRLRRLRLQHIAGLDALRLDAAATLEELRLDDLRQLALLELDTPGLRALRVAGCYNMLSDGAACATMCLPDRLRFHGAASVRAMEKIELLSHAPGERWNAGAVGLLRLCTAADSLKLSISPYEENSCLRPSCMCKQEDDPMISLQHTFVKLSSLAFGGHLSSPRALCSL